MKYLSLFILLLLSFINCTHQSSAWNGRLIFQKIGLGKDRLSTGNSMLLLPLITSYGYDTTVSMTGDGIAIGSGFSSTKIQICSQKEYAKIIVEHFSTTVCNSFFESFIQDDVLLSASFDSVWSVMPCHYLLVSRMKSGVRIKTFDNRTKLRATIEGELWDAKAIEVVWRANVSGIETNNKTKNHEFIKVGIDRLLAVLPDFLPVANMENW